MDVPVLLGHLRDGWTMTNDNNRLNEVRHRIVFPAFELPSPLLTGFKTVTSEGSVGKRAFLAIMSRDVVYTA